MKTNQLLSRIIAALCLTMVPGLSRAQHDITELNLNVPVEREITGGEVHIYHLALQAGQSMLTVVDQRGIDVFVRVFDPAGVFLREIDSPNGAYGPEPISLQIVETGKYCMEVRPLDERQTIPGMYAIETVHIEPIASTLEGKVDQLFALWDRPDSPGAAIAIMRDGEVIYQHGYGSANLEYSIPITPSTIFHVASVSKQFTAFAVAMFAAEGRLSLDEDVRTYLPEIPDFGEKITLRHLIYHTSGLRDQWNLLEMAGWRMDDVITREHILEIVSRQKELNFKPGEELVYCNTGYTLLAEIVARVTGQTFREWTAENLFEPLGMANTHFHDDHQMIVPNRAYSYGRGQTATFRKSVLNYANVGATSLFTTVEDLAKWMNNLDTGTIGGADVIDQVQNERVVLNSGDTLGYAFGLSVGEYRGLNTVGHSGGDAGFRSYVVRFPEQHFAVAVLSNLADVNPGALAMDVAEIYLADQMAPPGPQGTVDNNAVERPAPFTLPVDRLVEFVGTYYSDELGRTIEISVENDQLIGHLLWNEDIVFTPSTPDAFTGSDWRLREVTFTRDVTGSIAGFRVSNGRVRNLLFERQSQ